MANIHKKVKAKKNHPQFKFEIQQKNEIHKHKNKKILSQASKI